MMHNFFSFTFISMLYIFRTTMCSSSGDAIVSIRHLAYVTLDGTIVPSVPAYQMVTYQNIRVTYARCLNDILESPDDEHIVARNM